MSVKKKLGLGVASAALGLALVGGGTWAAFNDTARINNAFAAGTLDLEVGKSHNKPISFDLGNLKPGDNIQRIFELRNAGTLAIKEVLLHVKYDKFVDKGGKNSAYDFLDQFVIDFMQVDGESNKWEPRNNVVKSGKELTLKDLVKNDLRKVKDEYIAKDSNGKDRINLASITDSAKRGIPVEPTDIDDVFIQITFKNDTKKNRAGEYVQNKFQGDSINFFFNLEATQWDGVHVDTNHRNGEINNGVQGSADGKNMPNPRTIGEPKHSEEVTD